MPAEILSLDLDWFNYLTWEKSPLRSSIRDFFRELVAICSLPKIIDFVPEHQYLYPWSLKILENLNTKTANVVNLDQHHDFYSVEDLDCDAAESFVKCGNFFAFMAHHKLLNKYTWITNFPKKRTDYVEDRLFAQLEDAQSLTLRKFKRKIKTLPRQSVFKNLRKKKFDGFMIVRSPAYTQQNRAVYHAVELALQEFSLDKEIRRYTCRANFKNHRVHHRANTLFQMTE